MGAAMELDAFLADGLARQVSADLALHDGDVAPRLALWSHNDPVTLFGAHVPLAQGWTELEKTFRWLAGRSPTRKPSTSSLSPLALAVTSRTPWGSSTHSSRSTVCRFRRRRCVSRTSTGGRTASGASCIATATDRLLTAVDERRFAGSRARTVLRFDSPPPLMLLMAPVAGRGPPGAEAARPLARLGACPRHATMCRSATAGRILRNRSVATAVSGGRRNTSSTSSREWPWPDGCRLRRKWRSGGWCALVCRSESSGASWVVRTRRSASTSG